MAMSEVEALLSVDRGQVPPATVAFFACEPEPEATERREQAMVAALAGIAAFLCALSGASYLLTALFVLAAAVIAIVATPTVGDDQPRAPSGKRSVTVVTSQGLIVRDADGLRSWRFDELVDVVSATGEQRRPLILLVKRDGTQHALDYLSFQRGEDLRAVIDRRLKPGPI